MKKIFKQIASAALAFALVAGSTNMTAFAAEDTLTNGSYTGTIHFHNASNPANYSMCDSIFAHEADIVLTSENAALTFYVAYPIPAYADQGIDGTITDVTMTYDGTTYAGTSDITTKATKIFDTTGALFGITAGDSLTTQAVTLTLPREAVDNFEDGIDTSAYVNVVMNTTTSFVVKITELSLVSASTDDDSDSTTATETSTKEVEVSADIAAPAATYTVTIPEAVAFGTLSTENDNTLDFSVEVSAANLGTGYVEVVSAESGNLTSGDNSLPFANSFGTQKASEDKTLSGSFSVKATDVSKAAAGNYTGTVTFTINYYAAN